MVFIISVSHITFLIIPQFYLDILFCRIACKRNKSIFTEKDFYNVIIKHIMFKNWLEQNPEFSKDFKNVFI